MKTTVIILIAFLGIQVRMLGHSSSIVFRDSTRKSALFGVEAVGGIAVNTIYFTGFHKFCLWYEFRRKSFASFITGIGSMNHYDGQGVIVPMLLALHKDSKRGGIMLNLGATAQIGVGQPFLFPTLELRIRFEGRRRKFYTDLIVFRHFQYAYDCPRSNFTCMGNYHRDGWGGGFGLGLAVAMAKD